MPDPVQFINRYTGETETEAIYGEGFLRFIYENPLGKVALAAAVKRAWFSRYYGHRMDRPASREKVQPFIEEFGVDPDEFATPAGAFNTFNEFFYRKLRPSARPIAPGEPVAVFPADGRHLGLPDLSDCAAIFAKGQQLDLAELLGDRTLGERFATGSAIVSRLCPVDYHRFHFPVAGLAGATRLINGHLFSVNPIALRRDVSILWRNKRSITTIESEEFGSVLMLEIGATCVGGTVQTFEAGTRVEKGAEKGYFKFGGSMTITVFEPGAVTLSADLSAAARQPIELYARMGDEMGRATGAAAPNPN